MPTMVHGAAFLCAVVVGIGLAVYTYYSANSETSNVNVSSRSISYDYPPRERVRNIRKRSNTRNLKKTYQQAAIETANDECVICFEPLYSSKPVAVLKCKHLMHKDCIEPWRKENNSCPICRASLK